MRTGRPVVGEKQPSSLDEALGWMADVDAPRAQKRIGPATSSTRRIKRKEPRTEDAGECGEECEAPCNTPSRGDTISDLFRNCD